MEESTTTNAGDGRPPDIEDIRRMRERLRKAAGVYDRPIHPIQVEHEVRTPSGHSRVVEGFSDGREALKAMRRMYRADRRRFRRALKRAGLL